MTVFEGSETETRPPQLAMEPLLVRLTVPIPVERTVSVPALLFAHWLPLAADDAIVVSAGFLRLRLWFHLDSTRWATRVEEQDLPRTINVPVHRVYVDVTIDGISAELREYIRATDYSRPTVPAESSLQAAYDNLCWDVLRLTVDTINRLTQYVRSRWGQHWLQQYEADRGVMASLYTRFEAKASVDGGQTFFPFAPTPISTMSMRIESGARLVGQEHWDDVRAYVLSTRRPPLTGALLASAESLAANGHSRGAITEAVTALEVALYQFASNPAIDPALGKELRERMGLETLKAQIERIGLTGSIAYLLPLLLPESVLPTAVLAGCREAISQRQNVVHSGQREVRDDVVQRALAAVRECCAILARFVGEARGSSGNPIGPVAD